MVSREAGFVSINPPSDIVLDVARAADPARSVAASERLAQMGAASTTTETSFANALSSLRAQSADEAGLRTQLDRMSERPRSTTDHMDPRTKAYRGLEALVLQNLVETMMPESEEFFGEGSAGMIWKSMLAQELGADLAKKVDLGIVPKNGSKTHNPDPRKADVIPLLTSPAGVSLQNRS
jgi:flagellar protein FlgJ